MPAVHIVGTNGNSTATRTIERCSWPRCSPSVRPSHRACGRRASGSPWTGRRPTSRPRSPRPSAASGSPRRSWDDAPLPHSPGPRPRGSCRRRRGGAGRPARCDERAADARRLARELDLDHTEVLGDTREAIAAEKLAVVKPGAVVVLPDEEFASLVAGHEVVVGGAREAASAFLGRPATAEIEVALPGRRARATPGRPLQRRRAQPRRSPLARRHASSRVATRLVASVLPDKDADAMLRAAYRLGDTLVATESTNARALPADDLAARAERLFATSRWSATPGAVLARTSSAARCSSPARSISSPTWPRARPEPGRAAACGDRLVPLLFGVFVLALVVGSASCGWVYRRQTARLTMRLFLAARARRPRTLAVWGVNASSTRTPGW